MTATEASAGPALAAPPRDPGAGSASDALTAPLLARGALVASHALAAAPIDGALRRSAKVLPEHARSHNRALVLQILYRLGAQSRADVARESGLTRVTVSDLVAELIADGLVAELGIRESGAPGKPARIVDVDRRAFQILGLDLSEADRFRGAVIDLDGRILARAESPIGGATGERAIALVVELVGRLRALATAPVLGIGVGSPGVVEPAGTVRSAPNLGWSDLALQDLLAAASGLPVHVGNDANVAALAEHGGGVGDDLLLVKIGHGVGAGVIVGGRVVLGSDFAAGEIGHVVVGTDGGPRCACGKHGCLEAWLAVPRLEAALAEVDGGTVRAAAPLPSRDDASARIEILREAGRRLGIVLAPVVGALNLPEVVLSGPTHLLDGALIGAAVETLRNRTMAEQHRDLRLRMTAFGEDIVLRGAAVMVLSGQLGVS